MSTGDPAKPEVARPRTAGVVPAAVPVRSVEALVVLLILGIAGCFAVQLALARPSLLGVLAGFVPSPEIVRNPDMLYIAVGLRS